MHHRLLWLATVVCLAGCVDTSKSSRSDSAELPQTNTDDPSAEIGQFGDFSFVVPEGWSVVVPDREKTKAMLLLAGTSWQDAEAMIKVDVGPPTAATAKQLAEGFAKSAGGTVSTETVEFDGTPGVVASTSSTQLTKPRKMIVIFRGTNAYLLMVAAVGGIEIDEALSSIRQTWKWTQADSG
ncbi:MAG: hypothetical protein AAGJ83_14730 [Planctomycetota bacterium]